MIGDRTRDQAPQGMSLVFACTFGTSQPPDLGFTGNEKTGWEVRRKIAAWCKSKCISNFKILRNTTYVRDLHGPAVYELYVGQEPSK